MARNVKNIQQLQDEVRARIALKKTVAEWIAEFTARTAESVKRGSRSRAQERSGLRPKMSDSEFTR